MNRKKIKQILFLILLIIAIANLYLFISSHLSLYTYPFNPAFLKKIYGQSQYVMTQPISVLPDETIYAHAAWEYINGTNPAIFNADQPPLGKYFIGLSELLFRNERLTGPVFNILILIAFFFLAQLILKDNLWAMGITTIYSFEKIFVAQMLYAPLLDNIQLFFILMSFIFYIMSIKKLKWLVLAFFMLGLVVSTKFWVTGLVLLSVWLVHTLLLKNIRRIIFFLTTSLIVIITLIASYTPSLLQGDSVRNILSVQHYIYEFHKAKLHFDPLAIWDLLLFNRWHVPWENVVRPAADWQWSWPIITVLSIVSVANIILSRRRDSNLVSKMGAISIWVLAYFILLFVGEVLPRYIFPVLPAMYIVSALFLKQLLGRSRAVV